MEGCGGCPMYIGYTRGSWWWWVVVCGEFCMVFLPTEFNSTEPVSPVQVLSSKQSLGVAINRRLNSSTSKIKKVLNKS